MASPTISMLRPQARCSNHQHRGLALPGRDQRFEEGIFLPILLRLLKYSIVGSFDTLCIGGRGSYVAGKRSQLISGWVDGIIDFDYKVVVEKAGVVPFDEATEIGKTV